MHAQCKQLIGNGRPSYGACKTTAYTQGVVLYTP